MTRRRFRGSRLLALPFSAELFCLTSVLSYQFPFFLVSAHCILFRLIIFNLPVWLCLKNELPAVSGEGLPPVTPLASHRPREHLRARPGRLLYLAPPGDSTHFQGRVEQRPCSRCGCRAHGSSAGPGAAPQASPVLARVILTIALCDGPQDPILQMQGLRHSS